ncbi:MAG: FeoC-like transcriptional regulator [Kiritimatiellae bacterium]|jgi:predicted ArsR family transcriptional regulator|nr:FeoC-like transcriptional regulator [Kiritimatiellia bacterium]
MIRDIKHVLREHSPLSLKELAQHFSVSPDTLRPMLQLLEDKQQIRSIRIGCSGKCAGCACMDEDRVLHFETVPEPETI